MEKQETGIYYVPDKIVMSIILGHDFKKDNIFNIVSNKQRQEIIRFCNEKKRTITEIQHHLGLSYSPTWKHVNMLIDKGLVIGTPGIDKTKGAVVYIKTIEVGKLNKDFKKLNKKYSNYVPHS